MAELNEMVQYVLREMYIPRLRKTRGVLPKIKELEREPKIVKT